MILTEQETMLLNDLKQQEELCRDKYAFYSSEAKDPELKQLFEVIQKEEAEHYDTISSLLSGDTPDVGIAAPKNYQPKAASMHPVKMPTRSMMHYCAVIPFPVKSMYLPHTTTIYSALLLQKSVRF